MTKRMLRQLMEALRESNIKALEQIEESSERFDQGVKKILGRRINELEHEHENSNSKN